MSVAHQAPSASLPPLSQKQINTTTWGTTGNTSSTITDEYVHSNSAILHWVTGATAAAGHWTVTVNNGSFSFTSSDSENSALPISYIVL